jgi:hypothetical protein
MINTNTSKVIITYLDDLHKTLLHILQVRGRPSCFLDLDRLFGRHCCDVHDIILTLIIDSYFRNVTLLS